MGRILRGRSMGRILRDRSVSMILRSIGRILRRMIRY